MLGQESMETSQVSSLQFGRVVGALGSSISSKAESEGDSYDDTLIANGTGEDESPVEDAPSA